MFFLLLKYRLRVVLTDNTVFMHKYTNIRYTLVFTLFMHKYTNIRYNLVFTLFMHTYTNIRYDLLLQQRE